MSVTLNHPHRKIWAIAGPAIVANSSAPLVGLVDTWVIGHLPEAVHLAAVSLGAMLFSYIFWAFGFLRMSTTGLIAQAHGRDDISAIRHIMVRSLCLGLMIALVLLLLQNLLFDAATLALSPPDSTISLFAAYFDIRIWSAPAALLVYSVIGYLIGTTRAKSVLVLQLVLNLTNGGLNLLFVLGFGLGVRGIAYGSLIAEWLTALVGLGMLAKSLDIRALVSAACDRATWASAKLLRLLSANGFIFIRTLMLMTALGLVTRKAGTMGEASLAASHVLSTFLLLISLGLDGFAYAAEALAGAAFGKGVRRDFRAWVKVSFYWVAGAAVFYSVAFALFGETLVLALTDIDAVRAAALDALPVLVFLPVIAFACYQFDGIYIGATAGAAMMGTMAVAFVFFIMVIGPLTENFGLFGLWLAVAAFMGARGLAQALYYPQLERALS